MGQLIGHWDAYRESLSLIAVVARRHQNPPKIQTSPSLTDRSTSLQGAPGSSEGTSQNHDSSRTEVIKQVTFFCNYVNDYKASN